VNAETAGLIATGRHDAPVVRIAAAADDGLTAQFGVVALLHSGKKGIHVDMDDLAEFATVL
jgi:hypothetical protein